MIIVTGGAGFIGSCIAARLNREGENDLVIVDHLGNSEKWKNLRGLCFSDYVEKRKLFSYIKRRRGIDAIVHMGACTSTRERDASYLMHNNTRFTLNLARMAIEQRVRFVYASSAATYGDGAKGFDDRHESLSRIKPLNIYGYSKHAVDQMALREGMLDRIAGLKFFNVFGPNEYHKGDMSSLVYKAFRQITQFGSVKLFKSYRREYEDGGQKRDFVYVKQVVDQTLALLRHDDVNGIFNAGSGLAHTFNDLAQAVFESMGLPPKIEYIDMPDELRGRYQYYTQAEMTKAEGTRTMGTVWPFAEAIGDYVQRYLLPGELHEAASSNPF